MRYAAIITLLMFGSLSGQTLKQKMKQLSGPMSIQVLSGAMRGFKEGALMPHNSKNVYKVLPNANPLFWENGISDKNKWKLNRVFTIEELRSMADVDMIALDSDGRRIPRFWQSDGILAFTTDGYHLIGAAERFSSGAAYSLLGYKIWKSGGQKWYWYIFDVLALHAVSNTVFEIVNDRLTR